MAMTFYSDYETWAKEQMKPVKPVKYKLGEIKVIVACEGHEVERIIEKEYGFKEFSIVASEEIGNYTSSEFRVDGIVDEPKRVEAREYNYMTSDYLNDLARRGLIQKGDYVVDTSW